MPRTHQAAATRSLQVPDEDFTGLLIECSELKQEIKALENDYAPKAELLKTAFLERPESVWDRVHNAIRITYSRRSRETLKGEILISLLISDYGLTSIQAAEAVNRATVKSTYGQIDYRPVKDKD